MALTYTVEIAFGSAPFDLVPVWTDVTPYVMNAGQVQVRRGRPDEFSGVQPGRCTLVLNNSDGRFTPGNTASPYWPNVKIRKRLRFTAHATVGAETFDVVRFDGHITDLPNAWPNETGTVVNFATLTAVDRSNVAVQAHGPLRSFLVEETLLDEPNAYLPLSDPDGSTSVGNIAGNSLNVGTVSNAGGGGTFEFTGTGPPADGASALVLTPASASSGYFVDVPVSFLTFSAHGYTLEAWITTSTNSRVVAAIFGGRIIIANLTIDASGKLSANHVSSSIINATSAATVANGATHHVALTVTADGTNHTLRAYLDGVLAGSASAADVGTGVNVDRLVIGSDGVGAGLFNGTISHVAFHPTALTVERINAHYHAGADGFGGERSDQRISRIASYVGLSSLTPSARTGVWLLDDATASVLGTSTVLADSDLSLSMGAATVYGQATGGSDANSALNEVAETENGIVLIGRDGLLQFLNRSHRYNAPDAFSLDVLEVQRGLSTGFDDQSFTNDLKTTTEDGIAQRAINEDSIAEHGRVIGSDLSLLTRDVVDAYSAASWRVNRFGEPALRWSGISVTLQALSEARALQVLQADISAVFRVSGLPAQAPSSEIRQFVEGYTETISATLHTIEWSTSSAEQSQVWVLDDAELSVLGTTTTLAY